MSLPKTSSAFSLPTLNLTNSSSPDSPPDKDKEKAEKEDAGTSLSQSRSQQQSNDTADPAEAPSSPRSPRGSGPRPRRALTFRELGISESLTVRPISTDSRADSTSPVTSGGKGDSSGSSAREKSPLASTPPRLSSRSSSSSPSAPSLSAEQQQYEDLADFVHRQRLGKNSAFDTEIPIEHVPKSLLHCVTNLKKPTVRISELMIHMFRNDLNKSNTWVIASEMAVKIKNTFHFLSGSPQARDEKQRNEEASLLASCAANFAGAFFNLSTDDKLGRLPASLVSFLEAADHRLIRAAGSPGKEGATDDEAFTKRRHDLLKFLLLDSFLIPIVQQDIFPLHGVVHVDRIISALIAALHEAVDHIAHAFFVHSIRNAREEVKRDFATRRMSHFQQKPGSDKRLNINPSVLSSDNANHLAESLSPRNPIRDRRKELIHLRKELQERLKPLQLPPELLNAIEENETDILSSNRKINKLNIWETWLGIASQQDLDKDLIKAIRDQVEQEREKQLISDMLLYLDGSGRIVTNTLEASATTTTATTITTTSLLSPTVTTISATTLGTITATTTTTTTAIAGTVPNTNLIATMTTAPVTSSSSSSNTLVNPKPENTSNSTQARHPITRTPRMVRGKPIETSTSSSPEPVSPRPLTRHQRSRTADAVMPVPANVALQLSDAGRQVLLAAFPELMLAAMKKIALRHPEHPVDLIRETQRNKLTLELISIPQTSEKAPLLQSGSAKLPSVLGHDQLLRTLLMGAVANSPAGKILAAARMQALGALGSTTSIVASESKRDPIADMNALRELTASYTQQAVSDLFGQGLANSGLPAESLDLWTRVDQQIVIWAQEQKIAADRIEELRSTTGFDLIVTRLVYPLAMGTGGGIPSVGALRFADGIRKEINGVWPKVFEQFKAMARNRQTGLVAPSSTASSASSSSSDGVPPADKKQ